MMPTVLEVSIVTALAGVPGASVRSAEEPMLFQRSLKAVGIEPLVAALDRSAQQQVEGKTVLEALVKPPLIPVLVSALTQGHDAANTSSEPSETLINNLPNFPAATIVQGKVSGRLVVTGPKVVPSGSVTPVEQEHENPSPPQIICIRDANKLIAVPAPHSPLPNDTSVKPINGFGFVSKTKPEAVTSNISGPQLDLSHLGMQDWIGSTQGAPPPDQTRSLKHDEHEVDPFSAPAVSNASIKSLGNKSGPQSSLLAVSNVKGNKKLALNKLLLRVFPEKTTIENQSNDTPQTFDALVGPSPEGLPIAVAQMLVNDSSVKSRHVEAEGGLDPLGPKIKRKQTVGPAQSELGATTGAQGLHNVALFSKDVSPETKTLDDQGLGQGNGTLVAPGKTTTESTSLGMAQAVHGRLGAPMGEAAVAVPSAERAPAGTVSHTTVSEQMVATPTSSTLEDGRGRQVGLLAATPSSLEVGISNGTHGWLKIRAQLENGVVTTVLAPASSKGSEMLHRELPSLTAFMREEQVGGGVLLIKEVSATGSTGSTLDADTRGAGQSAQQRFQERENPSPGSVPPKDEIWNHSDRDLIDQVSSAFGEQPGYLRNGIQGSWLNVRV